MLILIASGLQIPMNEINIQHSIFNIQTLNIMYIVSIISFLLLAVFLLACASKHGVPSMISDTWYQLDASERWAFPLILATSALLMMPLLLEARPVVLSFLVTAGLLFVAASPGYRQDPDRTVHKAAASLSAAAALLWSVTATAWPTIVLLLAYTWYILIYATRRQRLPDSMWYWAETACILDVYISYWVITA